MRRTFSALAFVLGLAACQRSSPFTEWVTREGGECDVLIVDARVVDGTGAPAYEADVVVRDGLISFVGHVDVDQLAAVRTIDATSTLNRVSSRVPLGS